MTFSDLLLNSANGSPANIQNAARIAFPRLLKEKGLNFREPQGPLPDKGTLVLLGIAASYSTSDLALLDEIYPALLRQRDERIEIFDASTLTKMEEWEYFIPGLAPIYHTPAIGIWHHSNWIVRKSGASAREFIKDRYK